MLLKVARRIFHVPFWAGHETNPVVALCRQVGDDKGRTHELEQSAVKCMRGLLFCYMRQAQKVRVC